MSTAQRLESPGLAQGQAAWTRKENGGYGRATSCDEAADETVQADHPSIRLCCVLEWPSHRPDVSPHAHMLLKGLLQHDDVLTQQLKRKPF